MGIEMAILGLLSWRALSGYELKKIFAESEVFYWSGNNNQIYKALVQLHEDGLVEQEIQYQESLPARKVYSLTEKGWAALKVDVLSNPELPEFRKPFLVQLAWADILEDEELDGQLAAYEEEVEVKLRMQRKQAEAQENTPRRRPREAYLWEMLTENVISTYENELDWVRQVRAGLKQLKRRNEESEVEAHMEGKDGVG